MSFYFKELELVVPGGTLMQRSVGRTDWTGVDSLLPTANPHTLLESIETKLLTLPGETTVVSGHGPMTTIKAERATNPFVRGLSKRWNAYDRTLEENAMNRQSEMDVWY